MKINAVIRADKLKLTELKSISVYISGLFIGIGLIAGSFCYIIYESSINSILNDFFLNYTDIFFSKTKLEILMGLSAGNLLFCLVMYFVGTNSRGAILSLMITFFKSIGIGVLTAYLYCSHALKGIEFCLLIFFPGKIILLFSYVLLTVNSFNAAYDINCFLKKKSSSQIDLVRYGLRTALIMLIVLFSSIVDFITTICFSSLFDFA